MSHGDPLGLNFKFSVKCPGSHIEKGNMVSYKVFIVRKQKTTSSSGKERLSKHLACERMSHI